jgi:putative transposase
VAFESHLGITANRGGDQQAGHEGGQIDGGEVSPASPQASFADLESVPEEPCSGPGGMRLFFTVPTVTCRVLFVFVILAHERRRIVHVNVTEHPTAQWTAQQIVEAFPWDEAPRYLLRDRDSTYGDYFRQRVGHMGLEEMKIAPHSPWQNPYVERLIGSIRRECLDEVIVLNERHLRRLLQSYVDYYYHWRTHRSLDMETPEPRPVQPPELGPVKKLPEVGGLHHHYERIAA